MFIVGFVGALIFVCLNDVFAGALIEEVDFSLSTGVYSKYIWRGQNLGDDIAVQPGFSAAYKGFTFSIWANYNTDASDDWTELDYTIDYTTSLAFLDERLEKLRASIGYTYYTFPNLDIDDESQEAYIGFSLDVLLSPSLTVYYDWDTGDGTYLESGISHTFGFEYFDITPGITIGYNNEQWGYDSSFSAALLSLDISIPIGEYISIDPGIYESIALDDQYDSEFYGGINVSVSF